jgi:hypothetical protein
MSRIASCLLVMAVLALPASAEAYIGPGAGITAIGTVIAFIGAIVFAIVGFVWYPLKRLIRAMRQKTAARPDEQKASPS